MKKAVRNPVARDPSYVAKVQEIIRKKGHPVSTGYMAYHLGISWPTSKQLLLSLALDNKLRAIKTTMGYVFYLPNQEISVEKEETRLKLSEVLKERR